MTYTAVKIINCRGKGPKRKHTNFTPPPLLARGGMSTPSGCRSPNLMLLGLEPSRGFSRSASCPHGQVFGGAVTNCLSHVPWTSRRQRWRRHRASDSCVWELPDIRPSVSLGLCHGPDRGHRRSCYRAARIVPNIDRIIRAYQREILRSVGNQCF